MANKNVYEIFDEFRKASNKKQRIDVLRKNDSFALRNVLFGTFHPGVSFTMTALPPYKTEDVPPGMSYNNMTQALDKIYLFMKDNPRTPPQLTEQRKQQLLIQILESLEEKEAAVFGNIILKNQKIPHLTVSLINEAFPGLLPTE